jgi:transcriptional regulator with XRE-family HTH domain
LAQRLTKSKGSGDSLPTPSLTEHIRNAAAASSLSVYRIAKETGVDQSTLNKFLSGRRDNIRLDVADRLFRFFFQAPRRKLRPRQPKS